MTLQMPTLVALNGELPKATCRLDQIGAWEFLSPELGKEVAS